MNNVINIVIIVVIAALVVFGIANYIKKLKKGGDCCPESR